MSNNTVWVKVEWRYAAVMRRNSYPTDLTDAQRQRIARWVPEPKSGGRPAKYLRREIVNAIVYLTRNGCAWRSLPHDLPPYRIVFHDFRLWQQDGTWEELHSQLRKRVRQQAGKISEQGGPRGFDGGMKTGRPQAAHRR